VNLSTEKFRQAVAALHRGKDVVYGNAWKKRGEVLSILANIARKVDRIEYGVDGTSATPGETLLDTAIDLLVYCLKYETYLADLDPSLADKFFDGTVNRPYSSGTNGFEYLLYRLDLSELEKGDITTKTAMEQTLSRFAELERCFSGLDMKQSVAARLVHVRALLGASVRLVASLRREHGVSYQDFLVSNRGEEN